MPGYTKLFSSIVSSTVWREDDQTRLLWVTMLALADRDGKVEGSVPGLAHLANIPLEKAKTGLQRLMAPDPYSRTPSYEGRRIEAVEGGWHILNYEDYRFRESREELREKNRLRQQRWRACHAKNVTKRDEQLPEVTNVTSHNCHAIAESIKHTYTLNRKEGVIGGGNHGVINSEKAKKQKPDSTCQMPGCGKPTKAGQHFCSENCQNYAKQILDKQNAKGRPS